MKKIKINRLGIRNNISFVLLIFLLFQCSEKEPTSIIYENGIIISQPYLWRVELSENEYIGGHYDQSIVFNNNILLGAMDDQDIAILVSVESKNGEIVWESDYVRRSSSFFMVNAYQNNNLLTGRTGTVLYQLNLENGDYTWTKSIVHHGEYTWITGIDDLFYKFVLEPYPDLNYPVISAQYGNIMNGNTQLFLIPDLGDLPPPNLELVNVSIGGFRYIKPFKNETSSEIFLLCYYDKQYYLLENSAEQVSESYAGLYNFSQRQWVYEKVELGNYNFLEGFTPTIIGDRFYHTLSGGITGCHELYTGEPVWKNVDPHQYAFT
ncbi:MAG: hypothetical protein JW894_13875, partial [Bacteroidales bacterium]|nr:hypothetical protein [Bacteroidales bacterium]